MVVDDVMSGRGQSGGRNRRQERMPIPKTSQDNADKAGYLKSVSFAVEA